LPAGTYRLEITALGFQQCNVLGVSVKQDRNARVNASLRLGQSSETVEVAAGTSMMVASESGFAIAAYGLRDKVDRRELLVKEKGRNWIADGEGPTSSKPLFTPRVRDYFPETMLWRPEIMTDKKGQAHISFPMGDSITAWKMSLVASTESGQVGVAEKELRTFQPFFVEHDPPKVLTQGDRISLPVVLRNYSDKPLSVLAELKPEDWFTTLSPSRQNVTVAPSRDASAVFNFQAASSTHHGKQRVTARNTTTGDAVEREVVVHPDGEEVSFTVAKVLAAEHDSLQVQIPGNALPGWNEAELRIYPNLMAHVLDAMGGVGARPVGCGEQITSVGYVNLIALQLLRKAGQDNGDSRNPRAKVAAEALRSVQEAYDQLAGAQVGDGGFSYWRTKSDVALTAYVVRFLVGAGEFITVSPDIVNRARKYLVAQQAKSGAWKRYNWEKEADVEDPNLTSYVARALALAAASAYDTKKDDKDRQEAQASLSRAFAYLEDQIGSWRDPYLVGNYALAAAASGRNEHISLAQKLLNSLAHNEGPATYWNLEANTSPFYGWGIGGRLETTALAVQALSGLGKRTGVTNNDEQIGRGLQYLLGHKDRYALWYSTQATQNVLEAMIAAMPPAREAPSAGSAASVVVNGRTVSAIQLPPGDSLVGSAVVELGQYLQKGVNQVQLLREAGLPAVNAMVLTSYYIPWTASSGTLGESVQRGDTRAVRLRVSFDQPETKVDDFVICHVQTERIGFKGYGMMMAEVGLPPGTDVERDSLEAARQFGVQSYEVQPDRVVFYVWPQAGGSQFTFRFRLRYRMEAMTTPSEIYDYYNPEARAVVMPVRFNVH
jgi:CD109 antigen